MSRFVAAGMLALDYLGLGPDRDGIRFFVFGDQPCRIQRSKRAAPGHRDGRNLQHALKKKGYTLLVDLSNKGVTRLARF